MALEVSLSYSERNDNKLLTIADTTLNYGGDGVIGITNILTLTLSTDITTSDGIVHSCNAIDLLALNNLTPASFQQSDMVWTLSAYDFVVGVTHLGSENDE